MTSAPVDYSDTVRRLEIWMKGRQEGAAVSGDLKAAIICDILGEVREMLGRLKFQDEQKAKEMAELLLEEDDCGEEYA